jgi:hypothetical protein
MRGYTLDPQAKVADEHWAIVYAPRRTRDRFSENCVEVVETEEAAIAGADAEKKKYAARVIGPARSSEGLKVFYLVRWLAE